MNLVLVIVAMVVFWYIRAYVDPFDIKYDINSWLGRNNYENIRYYYKIIFRF